MRFVCLLLLVVVSALAEKKPVTKLQIGVKKRIPAEDCPIKTRNGDNLHMVNTQINEKLFKNQNTRKDCIIFFSTTPGLCMKMVVNLTVAFPGTCSLHSRFDYPTLHH